MSQSPDIDALVKFLHDCARYFEERPTNGEDSAHWSNVYNSENCDKAAAALAALSAEATPPFQFDRYINGTLMAEGVTIERQPDLISAMCAAAKIASRGPHGEVPVLVLRPASHRRRHET